MSPVNPVIAASVSQNNKTSLSFSPTVQVPVGELVWLALGSNVVDTANVTITDSKNNLVIS